MPSQRKRIGFLPRAEVQNIINQFCKFNKLSQSKVTGILVDEALNARGLLSNNLKNKSYQIESDSDDELLTTQNIFKNEKSKITDNFNLDESYIKDEVQMINDFIEFKFFKNIMSKNIKNI